MPELPLLKYVAKKYPENSLEGTFLIACQHILPTTVSLFQSLVDKGLEPSNIHLIGKCYSTNEDSVEALQKMGITVASESSSFDSYTSFDEQFQSNIESFFSRIKSIVEENTYKKILILDDGGNLIAYANDFIADCSNVASIEQTSSGYEKLKTINLRFPVVNIARSKAKLDIESSFIAEVITQKIDQYLNKHSVQSAKFLVIGNGAIGSATANLLRKKYAVNVYDVKKDKSDLSDYKNRLAEFDVIVGGTGTSVIQPGEFSLLKPNVLLVSASSSDREFSAVYLRRLMAKTTNCHADIETGNIILLNSGFPINFNDGQEAEAPEKIQLTRALLLAGILEASKKSSPDKFVDLDELIQKDIVDQYQAPTPRK